MQNRRDFLNIRQRAHSKSEGYWLHVSREAMACRFEVTLPTCEHNGAPAAREALDEIERARSLVGSDRLTLDVTARTVRFAKFGVEINFGSIGKGYALDRVAALIRGRVATALLNAGASSIVAIGNGERVDGGWIVGL